MLNMNKKTKILQLIRWREAIYKKLLIWNSYLIFQLQPLFNLYLKQKYRKKDNNLHFLKDCFVLFIRKNNINLHSFIFKSIDLWVDHKNSSTWKANINKIYHPLYGRNELKNWKNKNIKRFLNEWVSFNSFLFPFFIL